MSKSAKEVPALVSVVITTYNYGEYIEDAIKSVQNQTYRNTEIVVIDDGSVDNTRDVVGKYDDVRYFFKKNGGISSARNYSISRCRGQFVVFLDADDKLRPTFVEEALDLIKDQNENIGFVYTQFECFEAEQRITKFPPYTKELLKWQNFISACILIKKDVLEEFKYDEKLRLFEDWDFYLCLAENGVTGVLLDKPLLLYRKHTSMDSLLGSSDMQAKVDAAHFLRRKHWKMYGLGRTLVHMVWYFAYKHRLTGIKVKGLAG